MSKIKFTIITLGLCFLINSNLYANLKINGVAVSSTNQEHYFKYIRHLSVDKSKQNGATWISGNDISTLTAAEITQLITDTETLETPARRHVADRLVESEIDYVFADVAAAERTTTFRHEVVLKMTDLNSRNFYWYRPDGQLDYTTKTTMWQAPREDAKNKGHYATFFWFHKAGKASDAIKEILGGTKKTDGECWTAMCLAVWWGQYKAHGAADFDKLWILTDQTKRMATSYVFENKFTVRSKTTLKVAAVANRKHVPGDWLYMKNWNYKLAINKKTGDKFYKKNWLDKNKRYSYSGENCFYMGKNAAGKEVFSGLGLDNLTEDKMRDELMNTYNDHLKKVIDNGGKIGTESYVTIKAGVDAKSKIKFTSTRRIIIPNAP